MRIAIAYLFLTALSACVHGQNRTVPDAREIFDKRAGLLDQMQSIAAKGKTVTKFSYPKWKWNGVQYGAFETRFDGYRAEEAELIWGNVSTRTPNVKADKAHYSNWLWDGKDKYSYSRQSPSDPGNLIITSKADGAPTKSPGAFIGPCSYVLGYHQGDLETLRQLILNRSISFDVRRRMQPVRGNNCYVVDAVVKSKGAYTIWIDPQHDYHIARSLIKRKTGDYHGKNLLREGDYCNQLFEIIEYQQLEGVWYPKKCRHRMNSVFLGNPSKEERNMTFTEVVLNPDHEKLGSFRPDYIPNGTSTKFTSLPPSMEFFWRDGAFVDKDGRQVDVAALIKKESNKSSKPQPKRR